MPCQIEIVLAIGFAQTVGDAVSAWLPDHIGLDKFAANYTQIYAPGITTTETLFSYAPCIISSSPVGAEVAATAINIDPLGVYITPEGANFQPEGFKARCPALGNGTSRQGRMQWLGRGSTLFVFNSDLEERMLPASLP